MGIPGNYRSSWDDPDPRPLPASLLRQYLIARMERADESPCLLSVLIGKSVDLVMGGDIEVGCQTRQKLFNDMIASFNTDLIGLPIADKIFSTLFNSHGLDHWLPIYESAHLTVYPSPEYSLRLLHLLRIVQISIHLRDYEETSDPNEMIIDLLEDPPAGPEYARLFAIDAFNIIAKANDTELMATFLASNTSRSLGGLSVAERVWCAAKQDKHDLVHILVSKALVQNGVLAKDIDRLAYEMILIIEGMVGSGADTHFGRSVIEDLVKCKDVWSVEEIRKEMGNPQT